jgi:hypothetical protein
MPRHQTDDADDLSKAHKIYGLTRAGDPVTDEMIERFAQEAERGYDVDSLTGRSRGHGHPPLVVTTKEASKSPATDIQQLTPEITSIVPKSSIDHRSWMHDQHDGGAYSSFGWADDHFAAVHFPTSR